MSKSIKLKNDIYLDGDNIRGKLTVDDVECKNMFNKNGNLTMLAGTYGLALSNFINPSLLGKTITISINFVSPIILFGSNETYNRILIGFNTNKLTFIVTQELLDLANERYLFFQDVNGSYISLKTEQLKYEIQCELGEERTNYVEYKEFSNLHYYSTNEHIVGTWTDGKTLYEKTIKFVDLMFGQHIIPHGINNVDVIMVTDKSFINGGTTNFYSVNSRNTDDIIRNGTYCYPNLTDVTVYCGQFLTGNGKFWGEVTLQYTKKTD